MINKFGLDEQKMYKTKGYFKYKILGESGEAGSKLHDGECVTAINTRSLKAIFDINGYEDRLIMVEAGIEGMGTIRAVCRCVENKPDEKKLDMLIIKEQDIAMIDGFIAGRLNSSL